MAKQFCNRQKLCVLSPKPNQYYHPLVLFAHCSSSRLYPLFHWSSVPTVPLYPLFLWFSVPTAPLVLSTHCSTGPLLPLCHWSTVPTVPMVLYAHCSLILCSYFSTMLLILCALCFSGPLCPLFTDPLYPLTLPFCYTYLLIISYFRTRYMRDYLKGEKGSMQPHSQAPLLPLQR